MSELPKLLGRNFLIGFLLPPTVYAAFAAYLAYASKLLPVTPWEALAKTTNAVLLVLALLVISVLLVALNRTFVRLFEGYPLEYFFHWVRKKSPRWGGKLHLLYRKMIAADFNTDVKPYLDEMVRVEAQRESDPDYSSPMPFFQHELLRTTRYFPHQEDLVLPTRFGNAMRAFEVYSAVVYGIEPIQLWNRISLIASKESMERIQDGRMPLDFNVNMIVLSVPAVGLVGYLSFAHSLEHAWWALAPLAVAVFSWQSLPNLAVQWGDLVKSAFDVHRRALAQQFGLIIPKDPKEERAMWRSVSRMMSYRRARSFDALVDYRVKETPQPPAPGKSEPPGK